MYSYHVARRNLSAQQTVYHAMLWKFEEQASEAVWVSQTYLYSLLHRRTRRICIEGQVRTLVDSRPINGCSKRNDAAIKFLQTANPSMPLPIVNGSAWVLCGEESWYPLWQRETDKLQNETSPFCGAFFFEKVFAREANSPVIWRRWLLRDQRDYHLGLATLDNSVHVVGSRGVISIRSRAKRC